MITTTIFLPISLPDNLTYAVVALLVYLYDSVYMCIYTLLVDIVRI